MSDDSESLAAKLKSMSPEQIQAMDSEALRKALTSILRPGSEVMSHKDHRSHSNINEMLAQSLGDQVSAKLKGNG
jgi:hypothetical protein